MVIERSGANKVQSGFCSQRGSFCNCGNLGSLVTTGIHESMRGLEGMPTREVCEAMGVRTSDPWR